MASVLQELALELQGFVPMEYTRKPRETEG